MVVIISSKGKIIFSKMEKIQRWIVDKELEWAWHIDVSSLLDMELNPIWPMLKEFLQAIIRFN